MILTRKDFEEKRQKNSLKIAFIGMSNIGKSFRSNQLSRHFEFEKYSVDDHIASSLSLGGMNAMAQWIGFPFEATHKERSEKYLEREEKLTKENPLLDSEKNAILDTTGSVIYLSDDVKNFLKENFLVVALDISPSQEEEMKKLFVSDPKPLIWGGMCNQKKAENQEETIQRCYPLLIEKRRIEYRKMADIIIPGEISRMKTVDANRFLDLIHLSLPQEY